MCYNLIIIFHVYSEYYLFLKGLFQIKQVKYNKQKLVAFNEFLNKILLVVCALWAILWIVASVKFVAMGQLYGLSLSFLFGSPALVWMYYRWTVYKKKSARALTE
jgi:hypothetical protein